MIMDCAEHIIPCTFLEYSSLIKGETNVAQGFARSEPGKQDRDQGNLTVTLAATPSDSVPERLTKKRLT